MISQKTALCLGEQICHQNGWTFDDVFRHQFRIGPTATIASETWEKLRFSDFWIEHSPSLPRTEIRSRRGELLGYCLGIAVAQDGQLFGAEPHKPITVSASFEGIERLQRRLAGRFLLLCEIESDVRIYPDAMCSLAFVTNASEGVVGSTASLALCDRLQNLERSRDERLFRDRPMMGEARDPRLRQALGNHYVCLKDFSAHRFWPTSETSFSLLTAEKDADVIESIAARIRVTVGSIINAFETTLPLTGGRDSRMLVAASMPYKQCVADYYVHEINWTSTFDVQSAKGIAAFLDIPLKVNSLLPANLDKLIGWDEKLEHDMIALGTGFAVPSIDPSVSASLFGLPENGLLLRGGGGEITRASRWPRPIVEETPDVDTCFTQFTRTTYDRVEGSLGKSRAADLRSNFQNWLEELPAQARFNAHDLAYIELWQPHADTFYYASRRTFFLNPMCDLNLLHQTMRFGPDFRKHHRLVRAILELLAPGLIDQPFAQKLVRLARA